jgi:3'(2'), 5'-bisphosphate nucleotidase
MEWDTGAAHAVLKGAGGNVYRLDTLKELTYGKLGRDNPFFVACSNQMALIAYDWSP